MAWKLVLFLLGSFCIMASESDVYRFKWLDQDKKVFVLQNRKFRKEGNFNLALSFGLTTSGEFTKGTAIQGRLGYFFHENWGLKILYSMNSTSETEDAQAIIDQGTVPFYRAMTSYLGGAIQWAPFYSKINTFNKIIYMDWILGLGLVSVADEHNATRFVNFGNTDLTSESQMGLTWNISGVFYLTEHWALRTDFTAIHYNADQYKPSGINSYEKEKKLFSHYDLTFGVQYTF